MVSDLAVGESICLGEITGAATGISPWTFALPPRPRRDGVFSSVVGRKGDGVQELGLSTGRGRRCSGWLRGSCSAGGKWMADLELLRDLVAG